MTRKRLQFTQQMVKLSDIKPTEGAFVSARKVERMKAEFLGTLPVSTETEEDWIANVGFLAGLIAALTTRDAGSAVAPFFLFGGSPMRCEDKRKYATQADAEMMTRMKPVLRPYNKNVLVVRAYQCEFCGSWHLTHHPLRQARVRP
jgi:hypothetical protein